MPIQQMMLPEPPAPPTDEMPVPPGTSPLHWALLILGAAGRRKLLMAVLLLLGSAALAVYYRSRTPLYLVEAKILVQKTQYSSSDDPARSAYVLVHRRENLVNLIKQTNLLADNAITSPSYQGHLPSWLRSFVRTDSATDDDPLDGLVLRLDRALDVTTSYDGTITITVKWPDPQKAYRLVETAQQNFLEARHLQEITATDEVISILQGRTATLREQLDRTIVEVQRDPALRSDARSSEATSSPLTLRSDSSARTKAEELAALKSKLDAKERAVTDVEDFRRRRLADLMAQLDEKRGMYSDTYPGVVLLRQDIESMSRESPQIVSLREEARKLREQYAERLAKVRADEDAARSRPVTTRPDRPDPVVSSAVIEQDERVREARARYASMLDRLSAAQLERDSARATFKHRYNIAWPAEVPREPFSPKPGKVLGLGSVAVLLFALLCAAAPDLLSAKIIQRWQIERGLELPVLTELNRR